MMPPSPDGEASANLEFTLVHYFDAPRERVFRMWRDPQLFRGWSAPTGFRMSVCTTDFRRGGRWHCRMVAPDGPPHRAGGRYLDIIEPESILMTYSREDSNGAHSPETCLSVSLDALGERIGEALRSAILVKPAVELHEPGSLPVSEGKAKRVVDLRPRF